MNARTDRRPCPVPGCTQLINPNMAMCRSHWNVVPGKLKQNVYHEYRHHPGQESHVQAVNLAVQAVEGQSRRFERV